MKLIALVLLANVVVVWAACSADASAIRFLEVHPDTIFVTDTIVRVDTIIHTDTLIVTDTICGC